MTIEVSIIISAVSVAFGIYFGLSTKKRNDKIDIENGAAQLTNVSVRLGAIDVKLETIDKNTTEIKDEIFNVKADAKEDRERLVKVEEAVKSAHKRLDTYEAIRKKRRWM